MTKENHYADSHPERKPNGVPRHKPGKKGRNREASYKQDDPDSHNDICKHKDPDPDDPGNPEPDIEWKLIAKTVINSDVIFLQATGDADGAPGRAALFP